MSKYQSRRWPYANGLLVVMALVALLLTGCKPGIPRKYLQSDEMADILYDYHLAQGIAATQEYQSDTLAMRAFKAGILEKHGVSEADFDSSMVYYTRHTKLLEDVYTKLVDRFNSESSALGGVTADVEGGLSGSDTANVWRMPPSFVLSPYAAVNRLSFDVKADTAFHAGDRMVLDFDAQFICQDGTRDASVVLAVTYDNDSTEFVSNSVMSSSHYRLQVDNTGHMGIKSIRGFFMLSNGNSEMSSSATTLKLLVITNVRLVRVHMKEQTGGAAGGVGAPQDSIRRAAGDSLPRNGGQPGRVGMRGPIEAPKPGQLQKMKNVKLEPVEARPIRKL